MVSLDKTFYKSGLLKTDIIYYKYGAADGGGGGERASASFPLLISTHLDLSARILGRAQFSLG